MRAVVSEKGQVTIPKAIRDRLGIRPGQILDFRAEDGQLIAVKESPKDPVALVRGILGHGKSTDEYMLELRGPVAL